MRTAIALVAVLALGGAAFFLLSGKERLSIQSLARKAGQSSSPELILRTNNTSVSGAPLRPSDAISGGVEITARDNAQLATLTAILASRNDNDPRLDTELKELSTAAKALFQQKYSALPIEDRNGRGTIVFLLGRNVTSEADVEFLQSVLQEEPCLNMANCKQPLRVGDHNEAVETGMEVSLAYPQLIALKSLERLLQKDGANALRASAREAIHAATKSPSDKVAEAARQLAAKISK